MHIPLRLQGFVEILLRTHKLLGDATDPVRTGAYALVRPCRHPAVVAADRARVRGGLAVLEAGRWGEVERGEGPGLAE